ncbi:hypothetical protein HDV01_005370 [Terramyces sp. JEL0728]|nr:hypothetical protein HDV01_005370 [Terramyces sp. JEL0728]
MRKINLMALESALKLEFKEPSLEAVKDRQERRQNQVYEIEREHTIAEVRKSHLPAVNIPAMEYESDESEIVSLISEPAATKSEKPVISKSLPPLPKKIEKKPHSKDLFEHVEILTDQYFQRKSVTKSEIIDYHHKFIDSIDQYRVAKQRKPSAQTAAQSEKDLTLTSSAIVLNSVYHPQKKVDRAFLQRIDYHSSELVLNQIGYALNHKHPSEAHKQIHDFENKQRMNRKLSTVEEIIAILSKQNRATKELQMVDDYLRTQPAFIGKPDYILVQLWRLMNVEKFESGSVIFRQGDVGLKWYVVLTGSVKVFLNKGIEVDGKQIINYIATMQAGEKFGDRALFNDLARSTTIIANQDTVLLSLEKQHFKKLMGIAHGMYLKNLTFTLQKFKFLNKLDFASLKIIADRFVLRQIPKGTVIIQQGGVADIVFFVISGKCAVFRTVKFPKGEKQVLMGYFNPNCTFNEEVVLRGKYMSPYTVTAVENCEIGSIVTASDWMNLPLSVESTKFITMTDEEILYKYNVQQQCKMFRKYQQRYVEKAIKVTSKNRFK